MSEVSPPLSPFSLDALETFSQSSPSEMIAGAVTFDADDAYHVADADAFAASSARRAQAPARLPAELGSAGSQASQAALSWPSRPATAGSGQVPAGPASAAAEPATAGSKRSVRQAAAGAPAAEPGSAHESAREPVAGARSPTVPPERDAAQLPAGWTIEWSRSHQREYYWHAESGTSVWSRDDVP